MEAKEYESLLNYCSLYRYIVEKLRLDATNYTVSDYLEALIEPYPKTILTLNRLMIDNLRRDKGHPCDRLVARCGEMVTKVYFPTRCFLRSWAAANSRFSGSDSGVKGGTGLGLSFSSSATNTA